MYTEIHVYTRVSVHMYEEYKTVHVCVLKDRVTDNATEYRSYMLEWLRYL